MFINVPHINVYSPALKSPRVRAVDQVSVTERRQRPNPITGAIVQSTVMCTIGLISFLYLGTKMLLQKDSKETTSEKQNKTKKPLLLVHITNAANGAPIYSNHQWYIDI